MVVTGLVSSETDAILANVLDTLQPCTSLQCHFIQNYASRVCACLAVACHLHFCPSDWDPLHATAVRQGGRDTEIGVDEES